MLLAPTPPPPSYPSYPGYPLPLPTAAQRDQVADGLRNASNYLGLAVIDGVNEAFAGQGAGMLRSSAAVLAGIAPQFGMLAEDLRRSAAAVIEALATDTGRTTAISIAQGDAMAAAAAVAVLPVQG